ncbi:MAG: ATP-binding cassette domain-containing protein, partial [Promethearchaeota archaeon]
SKDKLGYYQKEIGLLLQNPRDNVIWNLTTYDNILLPMAQTSKFVSSEDREERISWLLKQFNLIEKAHRRPKVLSGGELQRLGLMVCLANDPELILLDEPTSQLDTTNAMSIMSYLRHLCTKQGKTVLMVTHDLRIVRKTDHCFVMKEGTLQELPINYLPTGVGLTYA